MSVLGSLQGLAQAAAERAGAGLWAGKRFLDEGGAEAEAALLAKRAFCEACAADMAAAEALQVVVAAYQEAILRAEEAAALGQKDQAVLSKELTVRAESWQQVEILFASLGPPQPVPELSAVERDALVILRTRDVRTRVKGYLHHGDEHERQADDDSPECSPGGRSFKEGLGRLLLGPASACATVCKADNVEMLRNVQNEAATEAEPMLPSELGEETPEELAETLFSLMDLDGDGLLSEEEVREMNRSIGLMRYRRQAGVENASLAELREALSDYFDASARPLNCEFFCERLLALLQAEDLQGGPQQQLQQLVDKAETAKTEAFLAKSKRFGRNAGRSPAAGARDLPPAPQRGPLGVPVAQRTRPEAPLLSAVRERTTSTDSVGSEGACTPEHKRGLNLRSAMLPLSETETTDQRDEMQPTP